MCLSLRTFIRKAGIAGTPNERSLGPIIMHENLVVFVLVSVSLRMYTRVKGHFRRDRFLHHAILRTKRGNAGEPQACLQ